MIKGLTKLFSKWSGNLPSEINPLPRTASNRRYYRISTENISAIGVVNNNFEENSSYYYFTDVFRKAGINVPEIYQKDESRGIYLLQDLGDKTLFNSIQNNSQKEIEKYYEVAIEDLIRIQIDCSTKIDFLKSYPRAAFDQQSILWDLNYFKYCFLKPLDISFNEQLLENDFKKFSDTLTKNITDTFMYRDFQSRNIMIFNNENYYIDFQGGRKGPIYYDLASLLLDAKAELPTNLKAKLIEKYFVMIQNKIVVDRKSFDINYNKFALIRLLQAFGAYGFRGIIERKDHFIKSIPEAINNLSLLLETSVLDSLPHLKEVLSSLIDNGNIHRFIPSKKESKLKVEIMSFAYPNGLPKDKSIHGGGYVFDCRLLHNPGRYDKYKKLSGKDKEVIEFFSSESDIEYFLINVFELVDSSVRKYIEREFTNLSISFGCTGGQHRSVYCAEKLAQHLNYKFDVNVNLIHREKDNWKI